MIGIASALVTAIELMSKPLSSVLIVVGPTAIFLLAVWLFESGKIKINERTQSILKKIGSCIVIGIGVIYIAAMAGYAVYSVAHSGNWQGVILLAVAGGIIGCSWYMARWRRWWVRFLKTFMPAECVHPSSWKIREEYYWTCENNVQYGLRPADGIFDGRARIWFHPTDIRSEAAERLSAFKAMLADRGIDANCTLEHIPGCIYADIVAETHYKTMTGKRQTLFRNAFQELDKLNYEGEYYAEYHGELGTILFAGSQGGISRAVRTEPREEYFIEPDCGFQSDEAYYFIERYPAWDEGSYRLITEEEFFTRWRIRTDYESSDEAFEVFKWTALRFFSSIANGDEKEQFFSRFDIENAATWLIAHHETDTMAALMDDYEESMYWAARLFKDVLPDKAHETVRHIVENCDNPTIVSYTEKLLAQ